MYKLRYFGTEFYKNPVFGAKTHITDTSTVCLEVFWGIPVLLCIYCARQGFVSSGWQSNVNISQEDIVLAVESQSPLECSLPSK